jgi:hypothetical protein
MSNCVAAEEFDARERRRQMPPPRLAGGRRQILDSHVTPTLAVQHVTARHLVLVPFAVLFASRIIQPGFLTDSALPHIRTAWTAEIPLPPLAVDWNKHGLNRI